MFRNKIHVLAKPPCSESPFLLRSLPLSHSPSHSSSSVETEALCWKISRRWRLACLPYPSEILLVYKRSQSDDAAAGIEEICRFLLVGNVGDEEEVSSVSLVARAVEWVLRCVMLDNDWRSIGDSSFVRSTFASSEERSYLHAINVRVQLEKDSFVFTVAPDVVRFSRHKMSDMMNAEIREKFDKGEEVLLEDHENPTSCAIVPSLCEGHIIGLSKLLPDGQDFKRLRELWLYKHGLDLQYEYYINVQLNDGYLNKQWFPSPLVLQGSGLAPAPLSVRSSKAVSALESFLNIIKAWHFFNEGSLQIEKTFSFAIGTTLPVWKKAENPTNCVSSEGILGSDDTIGTNTSSEAEVLPLALDFRTPKPALSYSSSASPKQNEVQKLVSKVNTKYTANGTFEDSNTKTGLPPLEYAPFKRQPLAAKGNSKIQNFEGKHGHLKPAISCKRTLAYARPHGKENALPAKVANKGIFVSIERGIPKSCLESDNNSIPSNILDEVSTDNVGVQGCITEHMSTQSSSSQTLPRNQTDEFVPGEECASLAKGLQEPCTKWNHDGKSDDLVVSKKARENQMSDPSDVVVKKKTRKNVAPTKEKHDPNPTDITAKENQISDPSDVVVKKKTRKDVAPTKEKNDPNPTDITAKIMDRYAKGELQSLTVAELKAFLACKKAKVGGKKEELIQRITSLLS